MVGTVTVFLAVVLSFSLAIQIILVLAGLLMIDWGAWSLTRLLVPNERRYRALRAEVNQFVRGVRRLNAAALGLRKEETTAARVAFQDALNSLHDSLGRIEYFAGKSDEDLVGAPSTTER